MQPKAIFLDRDGTLIVDRGYLSDPAGVELLPGVRDTLHALKSQGFLLFLFTNQSGVGRGMFDLDAVIRCNQRMLELLGLPAPGFTDICNATEAPDEAPIYRKPSPRFILEMMTRHSLQAKNIWMIGDKLSDVQAGLNANVQPVLVGGSDAPSTPAGVWRCSDLAEFGAQLSKLAIGKI